MRLPHQNFVEGWKPFELNGTELSAEVHERHPPGFTYPARTLYLVPRGETASTVRDPHSPDVTKILFMLGVRNPERVIFLGMNLGRSLRGQGLGRELFRMFADRVEKRGESLGATGRIHKPVLALMLAREGWQPTHNDFVAEVLPPADEPGAADVPLVRFLLDSEQADSQKITGSRHGLFYEVAPPGQAPDAVDYTRVVSLHTPYTLTG